MRKVVNSTNIKQVVRGKPHMALIMGYWRVSPLPLFTSPTKRLRWVAAYTIVSILNKQIDNKRYTKCDDCNWLSLKTNTHCDGCGKAKS